LRQEVVQVDVNAELARRQQLTRDEGMCGELAPDGSRICILAPGHPEPHPWDETGPLAQQFAQAADAMTCHATPIMSGGLIGGMTHDPALCSGCRGRAALSAIERHVQDIETALRARVVVLEGALDRAITTLEYVGGASLIVGELTDVLTGSLAIRAPLSVSRTSGAPTAANADPDERVCMLCGKPANVSVCDRCCE
jgi:hypothetical protein